MTFLSYKKVLKLFLKDYILRSCNFSGGPLFKCQKIMKKYGQLSPLLLTIILTRMYVFGKSGASDIVLMFLLLTFNIFHTFF